MGLSIGCWLEIEDGLNKPFIIQERFYWLYLAHYLFYYFNSQRIFKLNKLIYDETSIGIENLSVVGQPTLPAGATTCETWLHVLSLTHCIWKTIRFVLLVELRLFMGIPIWISIYWLVFEIGSLVGHSTILTLKTHWIVWMEFGNGQQLFILLLCLFELLSYLSKFLS